MALSIKVKFCTLSGSLRNQDCYYVSKRVNNKGRTLKGTKLMTRTYIKREASIFGIELESVVEIVGKITITSLQQAE